MKTIRSIITAITVITFIGCGSGHEHHDHSNTNEAVTQDTTAHHKHAHAKYQCPMDCENGKTYNEPGKCPVCEMDMEEVTQE